MKKLEGCEYFESHCTIVTVVATESIDTCAKEKGCGSISGVTQDIEAAVFLLLSDGYFGSRSLGCDQKSQCACEAGFIKQSRFSGDIPGTVTDDRERDGEAGRLRWRQ